MKAKQINLCFTEILISHGALTKKEKKWPETELAPEQQATKVALKLLNFYAGGSKPSSQFFLFIFFPQSVSSHSHSLENLNVISFTGTHIPCKWFIF